MSQGPIIVSGEAGKMKEVADQPEAYGYSDKWEFLGVLDLLPAEHRRDCSCTGEQHDYFCSEMDGVRPVSVEDAKKAVENLSPIWQDVLTFLEKDPDAFIVVR